MRKTKAELTTPEIPITTSQVLELPDCWELREAILRVLDSKVTLEDNVPGDYYCRHVGTGEHNWRLCTEGAGALLDLALRAIVMGKLPATIKRERAQVDEIYGGSQRVKLDIHYVRPAEFVKWAHGKGYKIPDHYVPLLESLPTPEAEPGTETAGPIAWSKIRIQLTEHDNTVTVFRDRKIERGVTAHKMGLSDNRNGEATTVLWDLLREFAKNHGALSKEFEPVRTKSGTYQEKPVAKFEKKVERLNKALQLYFKASNKPIVAMANDGRPARWGVRTEEYRCQFQIEP